MAKVKDGSRVRINFTGTLEDGTVFDTTYDLGQNDCTDDDCSDDDCGCNEIGPMELTLGDGDFFPQVEEALVGMEPGEKKKLVIPFAEAFGAYDEERVFTVERKEFPASIEPKVDQTLELIGDDGESLIVTVAEIEGDTVTLDANHPLAGEDLHFDLELVDIL